MNKSGKMTQSQWNPIPGPGVDESRNLLVHDHAGVSVIAPSAVWVYADKTFLHSQPRHGDAPELRLGLEGALQGICKLFGMIWNYGSFRLMDGKTVN
jgi:hypothetical protein